MDPITLSNSTGAENGYQIESVSPSPAMTLPEPGLGTKLALTAGLTLFSYAVLCGSLAAVDAIGKSSWYGKVKTWAKGDNKKKISPEAAIAVDGELATLRAKLAEKDQMILAQQNELAENHKDYSVLEEELLQLKTVKA